MWKEKLESRKVTQRKKDNFSDWMYLPDLILEHIFKFLSYRVSGLCISLSYLAFKIK